MSYRTTKDVVEKDGVENLVERIGHSVCWSPAMEASILPDRKSEVVLKASEIGRLFPDVVEPSFDDLDGPSVTELKRIEQEAA